MAACAGGGIARTEALLNFEEVACLLRIDRRAVADAVARGDLDAVTQVGAVLVDGDALWSRLDPQATSLPQPLLANSRAAVAQRPPSSLDTC